VDLQIGLLEIDLGADEFILELHDDPVLDLLPFRWHIVALVSHLSQQVLQPCQLCLALLHKLSVALSFLRYLPQLQVFLVETVELELDASELSCIGV
jgi:hypothetical protein